MISFRPPREASPDMPYSLTWLPDALRQSGLKVALVDGWETRGRAEMGPVQGVICHHTGTAHSGNMPSLRTLIEGRPDLSGPLAQLGLGRDGTYYVVAAGRCNHAGAGAWHGVTTGNSNFIGIEAENNGTDEAWPDVQMDAYRRGVAAILQRVHHDVTWCAGHKEYALPVGRKNDPTFDMAVFRDAVASLLAGTGTTRPPIPASEPPGPTSRPTLRRGANGALVEALQRSVGAPSDGHFGAITEAAVRAFQRTKGLVPDGIVGPATWHAII
jgi:peptidoglycan hydrolase-like protein with peptidoglycan-binding domain